MSSNVFQGPGAVRAFLNPDNQPPAPLVELPKEFNPFLDDGVRIYAKLMGQLPLANIKSLPALNMLLEKERNGELDGVTTLIENSSGNTVFSLAILARLFGIQHTKAFVSHEVSAGKLALLRFFGVEATVNQEPICPDPGDKTSGIYKSRTLGAQPGWWNPGQYDNEANPCAHMRWTGPQIWHQTEGKICIFCAGLGTTGTMVGAGGYLKKQSSKLKNIGIVRAPNNPVPGVRTQNLLHEIAFPWCEEVDEVVEIGTKESFGQSLFLCRHGLFAGPSSGFALAGLLEFLKEAKAHDQLDALRNEDGEIVCVFICPDSPFPYLNEYFEYLDPSSFPVILNAHLLQTPLAVHRDGSAEQAQVQLTATDIPPAELHERIFQATDSTSYQIIDIRDAVSFAHVHLPQAIQMDGKDILDAIEEKSQEWQGMTIYLVCAYGNRSRIIANLLRRHDIKAHSLQGGMLEWSRLNLPRWKPEGCLRKL